MALLLVACVESFVGSASFKPKSLSHTTRLIHTPRIQSIVFMVTISITASIV